MTGHAVYVYEDDAFLIDNVAHFIKNGLERQETVIVAQSAELEEVCACHSQVTGRQTPSTS